MAGGSPSYATITHVASVGSVNNKTCNVPTNVLNDLILVHMAEYDNTGSVITAPTGYTEITLAAKQQSSPFFVQQKLAYKFSNGSEPATVSWTDTVFSYAETQVSVYRNVDVTNPLDTNSISNGGSTASVTTGSIVPVTNGNMIVLHHVGYGNSISVAPTGMTSRLTTDGVCNVYDLLQAVAASLSKTYTRNGSDGDDPWVNSMISLRPKTL